MKQPAILMSFTIASKLVINKLRILRKWLKLAKNSFKIDLWYFDKNVQSQKIENVLNEVICLYKSSK